MRRLTRQTLSVLLAFAVVGTAAGGALVYDGPESPVGEGDAIVVSGTAALGIAVASGAIGAGGAGAAICHGTSVDCLGSGETEDELAGADATETKQQIWFQSETANRQSALLTDSTSNHLADGSEIALMEGQNEIIRALRNDTSTSQAVGDGVARSDDWYSAREMSIVKDWNTRMRVLDAQIAKIKSTDGLTVSDVFVYASQSMGVKAPMNGTVTLTNGTEVDILLLNGGDSTLDSLQGPFHKDRISFPSDTVTNSYPYDVAVKNSDGDQRTYIDGSSWKNATKPIPDEATATEDKLTQFGSLAYDAVQSGELDGLELINPYLGAREYSPEGSEYGQFALRSLRSAGYTGPVDLANTSVQNVTFNGTTQQGILMSDGLPSNGGFEFGKTYTASNITGAQYLVSPNGTETTEITGDFALQSKVLPDGTTVTNGSEAYRTNDYNQTSVKGFKKVVRVYKNASQDIDKRQDNLRSSSGLFGGLLGGGGGAGPVVVGALVLAGGYLYLREQDGDGVTVQNRIPKDIRRRRD